MVLIEKTEVQGSLMSSLKVRLHLSLIALDTVNQIHHTVLRRIFIFVFSILFFDLEKHYGFHNRDCYLRYHKLEIFSID